jgi:hypothetical protein
MRFGVDSKGRAGVMLLRGWILSFIHFFPIALALHDKDFRVLDEPVCYGCGNSGAFKFRHKQANPGIDNSEAFLKESGLLPRRSSD